MHVRLLYPRFPDTFWSFKHALAFVHSSLRLGIIGRERFHYWRLLAWTLFHRPRHMPLAVTLAIYGHHFRKCSAALAR